MLTEYTSQNGIDTTTEMWVEQAARLKAHIAAAFLSSPSEVRDSASFCAENRRLTTFVMDGFMPSLLSADIVLWDGYVRDTVTREQVAEFEAPLDKNAFLTQPELWVWQPPLAVPLQERVRLRLPPTPARHVLTATLVLPIRVQSYDGGSIMLLPPEDTHGNLLNVEALIIHDTRGFSLLPEEEVALAGEMHAQPDAPTRKELLPHLRVMPPLYDRWQVVPPVCGFLHRCLRYRRDTPVRMETTNALLMTEKDTSESSLSADQTDEGATPIWRILSFPTLREAVSRSLSAACSENDEKPS